MKLDTNSLAHTQWECKYHIVFTDLLPQEEDTLDSKNLELKLGHILYHLKENPVNIRGIIATDGDNLFMTYFKQYLTQLLSRYAILFPQAVPEDFLIHHLVGSFAETIKWWISRNMEPDCESVTHFYIEVVSQ